MPVDAFETLAVRLWPFQGLWVGALDVSSGREPADHGVVVIHGRFSYKFKGLKLNVWGLLVEKTKFKGGPT